MGVNLKGFGTTRIVIIVLAVALAGAVGWIVWDSVSGSGDGSSTKSTEKTVQQQMEEAYFAVNTDQKDTVTITPQEDSISSSGIDGYENVRASVTSGDVEWGVYFFRKDGGDWLYGIVGQDAGLCSDVTNPEAQKGLANLNCFASPSSQQIDSTYGAYNNLL